ncbi:Secreted RxLR effector peptide protein [Phytophthora palmivora]|uniref:RxLR effector protein n=1 Tax=Phytophthora palmivora TaxID=4796 RepID=A0A2P4Y1F6_9STRA|nr:Secreted RxLR effector peptide protein [Phytophthora palmivora]
MRFSYLLVSAAIVTATHESVSVASAFDNTKVSQGTMPDSEVQVESLNPKRLLRSYKVDDDDGEEERGKWSGYDAKWIPKVAGWVDDGMLPSKLKAFYEQKSARGMDALRKRKYDLFNAAFLKKYPNGVNADGLK